MLVRIKNEDSGIFLTIDFVVLLYLLWLRNVSNENVLQALEVNGEDKSFTHTVGHADCIIELISIQLDHAPSMLQLVLLQKFLKCIIRSSHLTNFDFILNKGGLTILKILLIILLTALIVTADKMRFFDFKIGHSN